MPRKRNTRKNSRGASERTSSRNLNRFRLDESYTSLFLGVAVVVIIAIVLLLLVASRNTLRNKKIDFGSLREQLQTQVNKISKSSPKASPMAKNENTYTVKEGDSLWSIAQSRYNNGNKWVEILAVNDISNPNLLYVGTKINLPNSEEGMKKYTVKEADSLWSIAVNNYADGYKWVKIAQNNNLSNPDWINPGQVLLLP